MTEPDDIRTTVLRIGADDKFLFPKQERDRHLLKGDWPQSAFGAEIPSDRQWTDCPETGIPFRRIEVLNEGDDGDQQNQQQSHHLWEALVRFPNAPVYGTHKRRERHFEFEEGWPNYHTMRVLGVADPASDATRIRQSEQIRHVYLLYNGLNETRDMLFHYRLAAWILNGRTDAVCIIRPLPGHLTRYPFSGRFSETPLDDYLRDPMDLFRQFLRHMLETQWLLSCIVPRSHYSVTAGARLLGDDAADPRGGRANTDELGKRLVAEWDRVFDASEDSEDASGRDNVSKERVSLAGATAAVRDLRTLLGWKPQLSADPPAGGPDPEATDVETADGADAPAYIPEYPYIHAVGYSMGGFMAQASFFAWPYATSSCTNMFAGGALRDLAPTAFAHPEEWQAVLHALRYELDDAFATLLKRSDPEDNSPIAGVAKKDFDYLKRIFYEVFLQYYRGGYSSRVEEFSRRLLFVVGGDDPIVRTRNVLDAGPPEGMTLLQLADVSHFPGGAEWKESDQRRIEKEQRIFWLPAIGRVIGEFSGNTEVMLQKTLAKSWRDRERTPLEPTVTARRVPGSNGLNSRGFGRQLDTMLDLAGNGGWVLASRNEVPPVFLGEEGFRLHAKALHHSEELIERYTRAMVGRAERLLELQKRMTLLLPDKSERWFQTDYLRRKVFARSETPGAAEIPTASQLAAMWSVFRDDWGGTDAVRLVEAAEYPASRFGPLGEAQTKGSHDPLNEEISLTILPDVWIALAPEVVVAISGNWRTKRVDMERAIYDWATALVRPPTDDEKRDADQPSPLERLEEWLDRRQIAAVKVSAAEMNPRYRGQRIETVKDFSRVLQHWVLCHRVSTPMERP